MFLYIQQSESCLLHRDTLAGHYVPFGVSYCHVCVLVCQRLNTFTSAVKTLCANLQTPWFIFED